MVVLKIMVDFKIMVLINILIPQWAFQQSFILSVLLVYIHYILFISYIWQHTVREIFLRLISQYHLSDVAVAETWPSSATATSKIDAENLKTLSTHDEVIVKTTTKTNNPTTLNKPTNETILSNLRLVPHLTAMVALI